MRWVVLLTVLVLSLPQLAEGATLEQQQAMMQKATRETRARMEHDMRRREVEDYRQRALADYERRKTEATRVYMAGSASKYYAWRDSNRQLDPQNAQ